MYLRKSRADSSDESVEETLAKHENILQDYSERQFGYRIPEENIYREVVSGESIAERIEIKNVLSLCETGKVDGIIVVEPQRLSRGDLLDCGRLIDTLRYSHTLVYTPTITYNLDNKLERRFFQDELMRGRDYLEYVKEILMRGRIESAKKGNFSFTSAPYGYDRVKIGKDYTLVKNDKAKIVLFIFEQYANGASLHEIIHELQSMNIPSPSGMPEWNDACIRKMLRNEHYIGKIAFMKRPEKIVIEEGQKVKKRAYLKDGYLVADGKHDAIISQELWDRVHAVIGSHPPVKGDRQMANPFAGLIFCGKCGERMQKKPMYGKHKTEYVVCNTVGCSKSVDIALLTDIVINTLSQVEMPKLTAKWRNGVYAEQTIAQKKKEMLVAELQKLRVQEERQYDMRESGEYSKEVFARRNQIVRDKMSEVEKQIAEIKDTDPVDYGECVMSLQAAITALKDKSIPAKQKNRLMKSIIRRITIYSNYTQRNGEYDVSVDIELLL